ncbi:PglZ domain-containing protein [Desulfobacterales bacterium HSG16]|nr:PglZ domain-containing protein [Desulfobacterales bacterium HSG16]
MNPFFEYITKQLSDKLKKHTVVVWYDESNHFRPYINALPKNETGTPVEKVKIADLDVNLAVFDGSFFKLRSDVEPLVNMDQPEPMLIYLPENKKNRHGSVLMELEKAGITWEPQLKRLARNVLRGKYTDGVIDDLLAPETVTYENIVQFLEQSTGDGGASMLKTILKSNDQITLISEWLVKKRHDSEIEKKEAVAELFKLIANRFGLSLPSDTPVSSARDKTGRYFLVNEFRSDLQGDPPESLAMICAPESKNQMKRIRKVCQMLRKQHAESYIELADQIESDLNLKNTGFQAAHLGIIDTFRFEEQALLKYCSELIEKREYDGAIKVIADRARSFWLDNDLLRRANWEGCRLMAELGLKIESIRSSFPKIGNKTSDWVKAYTTLENQASKNQTQNDRQDTQGWFEADLLHRNLEAWFAKMDEEPEAEKALALIRREYEELLKKMTYEFTTAFKQGEWVIGDTMLQTHIYPEMVESLSGRTAYFYVDAMRYEMGVELYGKLTDVEDLTIRPAICAMPTITSVGMAALLPGASSSFSVVNHKNKLAARIDDTPMPDYSARSKFLKARVPKVYDVLLGKLLQSTTAKLKKQIEHAPLVVVRSQEIDALGEGGDDWLARQLMDSVIGNIARAIRKLSKLGIEHFVVTADHGYQFSLKKEEDMRIDNPGGNTLEIHRRCWIGQGGKTPPGTVRITGAELGYDTDQDFIFPTGLAVLKAHGGLSYHHGGISLQELVIPVISLRIPGDTVDDTPSTKIDIKGYPETLTNRTIGINISLEPDMFDNSPAELRIILLDDGQQVGHVGMANNADFDRTTGCIMLNPGKTANIGMMLTRDDCKNVRIVVQDPSTDAVLAQSEKLPVKLGI